MAVHARLTPTTERIASECVDVGFDVHRALGPGFKERIYQDAYCLELQLRGIGFEREKSILVRYKNWDIPGQRVDLIVGGLVLVEIKAVPQLHAIHTAQTLSYLRTTGLRLGLILNFNTKLLKHGLKRIIL
jgi:GxxExxY protein